MRTLASIQTVNAVEPIPNADAIEHVRVLGWRAVGKKDEYRPGDQIIASPEGTSVLNPAVQCEGVALRPPAELYDPDLDGCLSFKVINPRFLLQYDE